MIKPSLRFGKTTISGQLAQWSVCGLILPNWGLFDMCEVLCMGTLLNVPLGDGVRK